MGTHRLPKARLVPPAVRAIVRERVDRCFDRACDVPLTVVVAPAGAGKTTAASHLVQRSRFPAIWYRAHPVDGDEGVLSEHLAQAVAQGIGAVGSWSSLADLAVELERSAEGHLLIVIDEFDAVIGTESECAVAAAVEDLSPHVHLVTLSRHRPSFNLSRMRLAAGVCEIGPDDLRFRSWEIERLFREHYGRPLPQDEVAELERRTGGWVAALQLFNLATTSLPAIERRAAIAHVGRRAGPDWDFLAENVLSGLPDELQLFLLETAPFERLTAELCDELRAAHDSWSYIRELEQLQLVTSSMEAPGSFRSHEVLREHLDSLLWDWEGADAVHKRYRRAAETLELHGHFAEALLAYCRGEDWTSVARLLGARGAEVADRPGRWLVSLPQSLVHSDPWLLLAVARQQRADGRIADAIATFQRVEHSALTSAPVTIARRERLLLASLVDRSTPPSLAWVCALRDCLVGDPTMAIAALEGGSPHDLMAAGIGALLAGEVDVASERLRQAGGRPDASPTVALAANIALLVAAYLGDAATLTDVEDLDRSAALVDVPFLSRLARAAAAMVTDSVDRIDDVVDECDRAGDRVGAAIVALVAAMVRVWGPAHALSRHTDALARCQELELPTLEVWVRVIEALGSPGDSSRDVATAESLARRRGSRALHDLAILATTLAHEPRPGEAAAMLERLRADHGLAVPASALATSTPRSATADDLVGGGSAALHIRCFGQFTVSDGSTPTDLSALRPRARTVLRMLAAHMQTGVHRNTLCEELWPTDDEGAAAKKLQVAVSSIRRVLERVAPGDVVRRDGDVYRLDADRLVCDVHDFSAAVGSGRSALARGDTSEAGHAFRRAFELYRGDLFPEEGAAEWVVALRHELQAAATDAAKCLAEIHLERGEPADAVEVCRAGLRIDRYCDPVWRLLLQALHAADDLAGHALALTRYDAVLAELGVSRPDPG